MYSAKPSISKRRAGRFVVVKNMCQHSMSLSTWMLGQLVGIILNISP